LTKCLGKVPVNFREKRVVANVDLNLWKSLPVPLVPIHQAVPESISHLQIVRLEVVFELNPEEGAQGWGRKPKVRRNKRQP
jgi:hypothetical protein